MKTQAASSDAAKPSELSGDIQVWRYMSFSRFTWMLVKKQLWLSRIDRLGDAWELTLAGPQLDAYLEEMRNGGPLQRAILRDPLKTVQGTINTWRQWAFVSCWCASTHESNALWRIYCPQGEGVVVQTRLQVLRESVAPLSLHQVTYCDPGAANSSSSPSLTQLATEKRKPFAYEQEVRILQKLKVVSEDGKIYLGHGIDWDPNVVLEGVRVHPNADFAFIEAVNALMKTYMPDHAHGAQWSDLAAAPPT